MTPKNGGKHQIFTFTLLRFPSQPIHRSSGWSVLILTNILTYFKLIHDRKATIINPSSFNPSSLNMIKPIPKAPSFLGGCAPGRSVRTMQQPWPLVQAAAQWNASSGCPKRRWSNLAAGCWLDFWWFLVGIHWIWMGFSGILMGFWWDSIGLHWIFMVYMVYFYGLFNGMYFWSGLSYEAHFGCPLDLDCKFLAFTLSGKVGGRRPKASDWLGGPKSYLENHVNIKIGKQKCSKTCSWTTGGCKLRADIFIL